MKITKLPAKKKELKRLRVAAYARVSLNSDALLHSLSAQVSYYTTLIRANTEWELAGIYVDEGISGTSKEKRPDFQRMMEDAENGKIDLILTKSVSRFARNTVDLLESVRALRRMNIEVRFEKEKISTADKEVDLMLSLLASFAQAESESISENVKWAVRKQKQQGIYHHTARSYGFAWKEDAYVIVPEEAEIVRFIFRSYLEGLSPAQIAALINASTVTGLPFTRTTVKGILNNRQYTGDRILQSYYSPSVGKKVRNQGQLPTYLLRDVHTPIITRDIFEQTQNLMKEKAAEVPARSVTCFTGLIKCGHCGRACCRRSLHGNKIWRCQGNEVSKSCTARNIREEELKGITFSIFADEDMFRRKVSRVNLFDDHVEYVMKSGKTVCRNRTRGRRRQGCREKR